MRTLSALLVFISLSSIAPLPARAQAATRPLVVVVFEGERSGIDPEAVRAAVARELGAEVSSSPNPDARGTLRLRIEHGKVVARFQGTNGRELTRVVALPSTREQRLEVIALLAGNLARDEASELARELEPKATPEPDSQPAAKPAPPPNDGSVAPRPQVERPSVKAADTPPPSSVTGRAVAPRPSAEPPTALIDLSLFHPLALYPDSHRRRVSVELGLGYSRLLELSGVGLSVGALRTDRMSRGAAVTGLWMWSNGDSRGAFASGLFATSQGALLGAEAAGLFTERRGDVQGAQAAGLFVTAGALEGGQAAGLFALSRKSRGIQAAGLFDYTGDLDGAQAAGIFNRAARTRGVQLSGISNVADDLNGTQISLVNVGGDVQGAQLGLVNIAHNVTGAQIGLFNSAEHVDGLSFAPVSVLRRNRTRVALWTDTRVVSNIGVQYSTERLYSLFTVGADPAPENQEVFATGAGIGVHVARWGSLAADADVLYRYLVPKFDWTNEGRHSTVLRGLVHWEAMAGIDLFAGAGVESLRDEGSHKVRPYFAAGMMLF